MTKSINKTDLLMEVKESNLPIGASYLSKKIGIPQATIGRMLTQLENEGLLEKISNKGRYLTNKGLLYLEKNNIIESKQKTADSLINSVEDISKERLLEILDVRKLLECRAIELACINSSDSELLELDNIMLQYICEVNQGGIGNKEDLALHLLIAKMSKNITIYQILELILTNNNAYTKFSCVADHVKNTQLMQHSDIVNSLKKRDRNLSKIAMEQHLNQVISDLEKNYI